MGIGRYDMCTQGNIKRVKVVIMIASPLTKRWHTSFCMDELANIFDLEYWNLSGLATPTYEAREEDIISRSYSKRISSRRELRRNLRQLPADTVVLSHIHPNEHNYKLHKLISSYQKNRVFVDFWGDYKPGYDDMGFVECPNDVYNRQKRSIVKRLKRKYYRNNYVLSSIVNFIRMHNTARFSEWRKKENCRLSYEVYNHYTISTTQGSHYQINLPDYETYLNIEKSQQPPLVEKDYILWVDSYFPFHPVLSSINPEVDFKGLSNAYFEVMNSFFEKVEKAFNVEVVIAAHPVSNYSCNPFNGRKVFVNKTAQLVKYSKAVMLHQSYSVFFEILWNKPTCFLYNSYTNMSEYFKNAIKNMSSEYGMPLQNMENMQINDCLNIFSYFASSIRKDKLNMLPAYLVGKENAELLAEYITNIHERILGQK